MPPYRLPNGYLRNRCSHPFIYFPSFFALKTAVEGKPLSAAVTKYKDEIWESCLALWKIWVPAQVINFAFVPRHLRIPFGADTRPGGLMPPDPPSLGLALLWRRCREARKPRIVSLGANVTLRCSRGRLRGFLKRDLTGGYRVIVDTRRSLRDANALASMAISYVRPFPGREVFEPGRRDAVLLCWLSLLRGLFQPPAAPLRTLFPTIKHA